MIPHWTGVHLSFLFYTPLPLLLGSALVYSLKTMPVAFPWFALALLPIPLAAFAFTVSALRKKPLAMVREVFTSELFLDIKLLRYLKNDPANIV